MYFFIIRARLDVIPVLLHQTPPDSCVVCCYFIGLWHEYTGIPVDSGAGILSNDVEKYFYSSIPLLFWVWPDSIGPEYVGEGKVLLLSSYACYCSTNGSILRPSEVWSGPGPGIFCQTWTWTSVNLVQRVQFGSGLGLDLALIKKIAKIFFKQAWYGKQSKKTTTQHNHLLQNQNHKYTLS